MPTMQLAIDTRRAKAGVREFGQAMGKVKRNARDATGYSQRRFDSINFKRAILAATAFTVAAGYASVKLVKIASDAEETQAKFDTVFKNLSRQANAWAEAFGDSVGRAHQDVKVWMAGLQDTFVPLGIARDKALDLSESLTQLAVDVASFNNKSDAEVIRDFTSALVGNHETVRKYGIIIGESAIEQEAFNQGIGKSYKELTDLQKVMLRYALIQKGTTDAQGDAIRTADSYANQMKRLRANIKNLSKDMSSGLLAAYTDIVTKTNEWLAANHDLVVSGVTGFLKKTGDGLSATAGWLQENINLVKNLTIALGGLYILNQVKRLALATGAAFSVMWAAALAPVTIVVAAVAGIGAGIFSLRASWKQNLFGMRDMFIDFGDAIRDVWAWLRNDIFGKSYSWLAKNWNALWPKMKSKLHDFVNDAYATWSALKALWNDPWLKPSQIVGRFSEEYVAAYEEDIASKLAEKLRGGIDKANQYTTTAFENTKAVVTEITDETASTFRGIWKANVEQVKADVDSFIGWLSNKAPALATIFKPINLSLDLPSQANADQIPTTPTPNIQIPGSNNTGSGEKATEQEERFAHRRATITAQMYTDMGDLGIGYYESQKALLDLQYEDYSKFIEDKTLLNDWYSTKEKQLAVESSYAWGAVKGAMGSVQDSVGTLFFEMQQGTQSISQTFSNFAQSMMATFQRAVADMIARWLMFKAVTMMFGAPMATAMGLGFAKGGVFKGGDIVPMANGSIVGEPTLFPMSDGRTGLMGEAGPEAIMPLTRTREGKLGVVSSGGGGATKVELTNKVELINQTGRQMEAKQGGTRFDGKQLITGIILKDIHSYGPIRGAIQGMGR